MEWVSMKFGVGDQYWVVMAHFIFFYVGQLELFKQYETQCSFLTFQLHILV